MGGACILRLLLETEYRAENGINSFNWKKNRKCRLSIWRPIYLQASSLKTFWKSCAPPQRLFWENQRMWVWSKLQLKVLANVATGIRSCHDVRIKCCLLVMFTFSVIMHYLSRYLFIIKVCHFPDHTTITVLNELPGHFLSGQQNSLTGSLRSLKPRPFTPLELWDCTCQLFTLSWFSRNATFHHDASEILLFLMYLFWDTIRNVITLYDQRDVDRWRHICDSAPNCLHVT